MEDLDATPHCLRHFRVSRLQSDGGADDVATTHYAVACKNCGASEFRISCYPATIAQRLLGRWLSIPNASLRPPHRLRCTACGISGDLFNAREDGYDGVLNGGCAYESGSRGEVWLSRPSRISVYLTYNINLDERKQLAAEAGVLPSDLFDNVSIRCAPLNGGKAFELDYECA
jgi:hypothetical protein